MTRQRNPARHTLDLGGMLSSRAANGFVFRGVELASMEGLLQGLKCSDPTRQATIFRMSDTDATRAARGLRWRATQTLYWNGEPLDRHGSEYQALLDEALDAFFAQNPAARRALEDSEDASLEAASGTDDPASTVLTTHELGSRLARLRAELHDQPRSGLDSWPADEVGHRHLCVIGDVHGHLQLALLVAARWQLELEVQFDAVVLVGDVGTFPSIDALDKATRRHAESNPCEIEFALQWMADPPASHLDRIFRPIDDNEGGLLAPVVMVTGNHEGFSHLETIAPARQPPDDPVPIDALPTVDRGGRIRLLPSGWRTTTEHGLVIGGLGGIQREQRRTQYHPMAYITDDQVLQIVEGRPTDLLVTHSGPAVTQPFPKGSDLLDIVAAACPAPVWCHGHSVADDRVLDHRGTTIVPLHSVAFGAAHGRRAGEPGGNAWCHLAFDGDHVRIDRCRPGFWRDFHRRGWLRRDDGQLVAPQLAAGA